MPDENLDLHKEMKDTRNVKYVTFNIINVSFNT